MALTLKDLQKNSALDNEKPKLKKKMLRPWESFDPSETRTRTLKAQMALENAKNRPELNIPDHHQFDETPLRHEVADVPPLKKAGMWQLLKFLLRP